MPNYGSIEDHVTGSSSGTSLKRMRAQAEFKRREGRALPPPLHLRLLHPDGVVMWAAEEILERHSTYKVQAGRGTFHSDSVSSSCCCSVAVVLPARGTQPPAPARAAACLWGGAC